MSARRYQLTCADGRRYESDVPGRLGGHRVTEIYGRLDCPAALRALATSDAYRRARVFFADEATAVAAGFRPCARCMGSDYKAWKARCRADGP
jgi:methylphosphotriester-DNA--protein-cysteine methyltransferase